MNGKIKNRIKRVIMGILACSMVFGLIPQSAVPVKAAASKSVSLSSYGNLGTVDVGSKTKSGTWWKMKLDSTTAFCLDLGKTCHSGNTYVAENTYQWNQDTKGDKAPYYAKVIRYYVIDCKKSKKGFIFSQALMWAISEGSTSESNLKNVIKQVKANTNYYSSTTVEDLYKKIFEPSENYNVQCSIWTKSGASKSYQRLMTVDAEIVPPDYKELTKSKYYRQRVTVHKKDEDGNALGGVKFTLSSDNADDLYSFGVYDKNGDDASQADEEDIDDFALSGETTDNGTVAWRMTFKLFSDEAVYYTDAVLGGMDATQKKAAKEQLEDDGYKQGVNFGPNMTEEEAQELVERDLEKQVNDISNTYTLTEDSVGNNKNIFLDPDLHKGHKFTLKKENSWQKDKNGNWPDMQTEHPTTYSKAHISNLVNRYKKASIEIVKKAVDTKDGKAHGDSLLDGAKFQLYADKACITKATVYDAKGNSKTAGEYVTGNSKFVTDYLRSGKTYYLKEIQAPRGFLKSDVVKELKVDASSKKEEMTKILYTSNFDEESVHGKIEINKSAYDPTGKTKNQEKNVTFQVYLKSKGNFEKCADDERDLIKTDANGHAITKMLVYGTYVIHQVDSGDEDTYLIPDFEKTISENGQTLSEDKLNEYFKAYLKIIKKDKNTQKTVLKAGTSYQIHKVTTEGEGENAKEKETLLTQNYTDEKGNQKTVDTFTCDETGELQTVDSIKSGTYRLYEVAAANGYHINKKYVEIVINSKADNYESYIDEDGWHHVTITVEYTNEETKGKLNIFKTGEVLKNWDANQHDFVYEDMKLDGVEFTVYADGDIETQDNQFTETDGKKIRDTWFKNGDKVGVITTGKGVEFTSKCSGITDYTMDKDGTIHISLPLGKYKVVETKTPYGYVYSEQKEWQISFEWVDGQDEYVLNSTDATDENGTLIVKNSFAAPSMNLLKEDKKTKEVIPGAEFGLYSKNDIYNYMGEKIVDAGALLATYTTDKNGKIHSDMKLPLMSENYGTFEESNPILPEIAKTMNSGDYYFKELSVSDSYYKDESPIPLHLEYKDAETKTIQLSNIKDNFQTTNMISKMDVAGSKEVDGCKLLIADKDGNKIVSWISGDKDSVKTYVTEKDGYVNFKTSFDKKGNLLVGGLFHDQEYTLTETRPADGYVTADSITYQIKMVAASLAIPAPVMSTDEAASGSAISATVTSGTSITTTYRSVVSIKIADGTYMNKTDDKVIMKDEQTHIQFLKLDKETGQALGGAKFKVTDKTGKVVMTFTTQDDAYDITGKLVVGETYTFTEISAPSGYQLAKPVKFTVKDTAKTQTVTVSDELIPDIPGTPQTGGTTPIIPIAIALIAVLGGAVIVFKKRK